MRANYARFPRARFKRCGAQWRMRWRFFPATAALGLGTLGNSIGAPAVRAQTAKTKIDVHHHFLPPAHKEALDKHKAGSPRWSVQMSLDDMDKSGIATSVLS